MQVAPIRMTASLKNIGRLSADSPVDLVLGGSFYPLHEGHLTLLRTAQRHVEEVTGRHVATMFLMASSTNSLAKKFKMSLADAHAHQLDNREVTTRAFIASLPPGDPITKLLVWYPISRPATRAAAAENDSGTISAKAGGLGQATAELRAKCAAEGRQLVQVCGLDSQVRAVVRGKAYGDVILIVDARGVPQGNEDLLQSQPWTRAPANAPLQSSTIERFLAPRGQYPLSVVPPRLDPQWLTDTGVTLGGGRQAYVRLMLLGARPVAVRVVPRTSRHDYFETEASCWARMQEGEERCTAAPHFYGSGTTDDGAIGYFVTDIGIPVNNYIKLTYRRGWEPKLPKSDGTADPVSNDDGPVATSFLTGRPRVFFNVADGDAETSRSTYVARERFLSVRRRVEAAWAGRHLPTEVAHQLRTSILPQLAQFGILHRDVKVENLLLMADGSVRTCDFGVAHLVGETRRVARGNTRQYPIRALQARAYDHACDEYMAAMAAYELLCGEPIYADCEDDVNKITALKSKGMLPVWPAPAAIIKRYPVPAPQLDEQATAEVLCRIEGIIAWTQQAWRNDTPHRKQHASSNGDVGAGAAVPL
jgi:cytidyltransferase-like protein